MGRKRVKKAKRRTPESDSSTDEDEKLEKPAGRESLSSNEVDYSLSPHQRPWEGCADELDKTELPYAVAAENEKAASGEVASVATGKKEKGLCTSTVLKPLALLELSWPQLRQLESSRNHGRLVSTELASFMSHFPSYLHSAVLGTVRVYLCTTEGKEEACQHFTVSESSKCTLMSSRGTEARTVRTLEQSYYQDSSARQATVSVLQQYPLKTQSQSDTHSGLKATHLPKVVEGLASAGYFAHLFQSENTQQVHDYWKSRCSASSTSLDSARVPEKLSAPHLLRVKIAHGKS